MSLAGYASSMEHARELCGRAWANLVPGLLDVEQNQRRGVSMLRTTGYDMIRYLFNRNCVDTWWQHHTTHLQQTIHTIHREYNSGSAGRAPSLRVIPWHLPYNWGKSTEKTSVRVAQYKKNEQAQRTNTIQEQYKNNNKHRTRTKAPYKNMIFLLQHTIFTSTF